MNYVILVVVIYISSGNSIVMISDEVIGVLWMLVCSVSFVIFRLVCIVFSWLSGLRLVIVLRFSVF